MLYWFWHFKFASNSLDSDGGLRMKSSLAKVPHTTLSSYWLLHSNVSLLVNIFFSPAHPNTLCLIISVSELFWVKGNMKGHLEIYFHIFLSFFFVCSCTLMEKAICLMCFSWQWQWLMQTSTQTVATRWRQRTITDSSRSYTLEFSWQILLKC